MVRINNFHQFRFRTCRRRRDEVRRLCQAEISCSRGIAAHTMSHLFLHPAHDAICKHRNQYLNKIRMDPTDGWGSSFSSLETALRQSFDIVACACATQRLIIIVVIISRRRSRTAQTNPRTICSFLRRRASFCMACCAGCWCSRSITSVNSSIRLFVGLCKPGLTMFEVQTSGDVCAVVVDEEVTICARALRIPSLQPAAPTKERKYCTWLLTPS